MDMTYLDNYAYSAESFIMFCDDMLIPANEGLADIAKSIGKGIVKFIQMIWNAFTSLIGKFVNLVREKLKLGPSKKDLKESNEEKEKKIKELDKKINDLENKLRKSESEIRNKDSEINDLEDESRKYKRNYDNLNYKYKVLRYNYTTDTSSLFNDIRELKKERDKLKKDLEEASNRIVETNQFNLLIKRMRNTANSYSDHLKFQIQYYEKDVPFIQDYVNKCAKFATQDHSNLQGREIKKLARDTYYIDYNGYNKYRYYNYTEDEYKNDYDEFKERFIDYVEQSREYIKTLDEDRFKMFQTLIMNITKDIQKWQSDLGKVKNQLETIAKQAESIKNPKARSYAVQATSKPVKWFNCLMTQTGELINKYMSLINEV